MKTFIRKRMKTNVGAEECEYCFLWYGSLIMQFIINADLIGQRYKPNITLIYVFCCAFWALHLLHLP